MKSFFQRYKHSFVLLYALIYMPWFIWLESRANQPYHVIHTGLDDMLPFVECFIVPYLLWFVYVAAVFVYPNGHLLRPASFERNNIFILAVQILYQVDTATNIFPSIHVYNSIAAHMAVVNNEKLGRNVWIRWGSFLLMVSIILATVFLKQHSTLDMIAGILLGIIMNQLIYHTDFFALRAKAEAKRRKTIRLPKVFT